MKSMSGGYEEFRYGRKPSRNIYVPGKKAPGKLVRGAKRDHLVSEIKSALESWRLSPFEHEANCRHGLRSGFCAEGAAWARADLEAEGIVAEALGQTSAKRPTWEEGQRAYTQSPDFCVWCQGPMDEGVNEGKRFCSTECAHAALEHFAHKSATYAGAVLKSAYRLIASEKAPVRECRECGKHFRSDRSLTFCSTGCANSHRRVLQDRSCPECNTAFTPTNRDQTYCSHSCHGKASARAVRQEMADEQRKCGCCAEIFQPTTPDNIYCSTKCAGTMAKRAYRERKGQAQHLCTCRWCDDVFTSKMPWATYCSAEHKRMADAVLRPRGRKPRPLSPIAFDLVFRLAA